jgi:hypothetical protein
MKCPLHNYVHFCFVITVDNWQFQQHRHGMSTILILHDRDSTFSISRNREYHIVLNYLHVESTLFLSFNALLIIFSFTKHKFVYFSKLHTCKNVTLSPTEGVREINHTIKKKQQHFSWLMISVIKKIKSIFSPENFPHQRKKETLIS